MIKFANEFDNIITSESLLYHPSLPSIIVEYFHALRSTIDDTLAYLCPPSADILQQAMSYGLMNGKRLRGIVCVLCGLSQDKIDHDNLMQIAAAIELIHAYTLIHDDLPSFDNSTTRRGLPSCHIQFDEPTAILAGNALLSMAFSTICNMQIGNNEKVEIIGILSHAIGKDGVQGGQMMDIQARSNECVLTADKNLEFMFDMIRKKTAMLFVAACECGAIIGNNKHKKDLGKYGLHLGMTYQIIDDINDAHIDDTMEVNIAKLMKEKELHAILSKHVNEANKIITKLGFSLLENFLRYIIQTADLQPCSIK